MDELRRKILTMRELVTLDTLDPSEHDVRELEYSPDAIRQLSHDEQIKALFLVLGASVERARDDTASLDKRLEMVELRLQAVHEEGLVAKVVAYLNENVLDPDDKLATVDLLDALASTGTQLVTDPAGFSSVDYQRALGDEPT